MKLETLLTGLGLTVLAGSVGAAFIDNNEPVSTVAEALKMQDNSPVVLEGKITHRLHKDKYQFTDRTGEITIEIDKDEWNGLDVYPTNTVRIWGDIEKDWDATTVDVRNIEIIP